MLEGLFRGALEDSLKREEIVSLDQLYEQVSGVPAVRDAKEALSPRGGVHVIAEIKRRSPSKGELALIAEPVALAQAYEAGGASAISVLTEGRGFGGSLEDLSAVSASVDIPVLRKDFIEREYQVLEARVHGADWILLIMAGLEDPAVMELLALAKSLGMGALVETHSEEEVRRALACGAEIIGVNARDLSTFEIDKTLFERLATLIPDGVIRVAESAVANSQDVTRYREQGAHAVLVGEALVTGQNPGTIVREFTRA